MVSENIILFKLSRAPYVKDAFMLKLGSRRCPSTSLLLQKGYIHGGLWACYVGSNWLVPCLLSGCYRASINCDESCGAGGGGIAQAGGCLGFRMCRLKAL